MDDNYDEEKQAIINILLSYIKCSFENLKSEEIVNIVYKMLEFKIQKGDLSARLDAEDNEYCDSLCNLSLYRAKYNEICTEQAAIKDEIAELGQRKDSQQDIIRSGGNKALSKKKQLFLDMSQDKVSDLERLRRELDSFILRKSNQYKSPYFWEKDVYKEDDNSDYSIFDNLKDVIFLSKISPKWGIQSLSRFNRDILAGVSVSLLFAFVMFIVGFHGLLCILYGGFLSFCLSVMIFVFHDMIASSLKKNNLSNCNSMIFLNKVRADLVNKIEFIKDKQKFILGEGLEKAGFLADTIETIQEEMLDIDLKVSQLEKKCDELEKQKKEAFDKLSFFEMFTDIYEQKYDLSLEQDDIKKDNGKTLKKVNKHKRK